MYVMSRTRRNELDIFNSNVRKTNSCWWWLGRVMNAGYGQMITYRGNYLAHRWAYTHFIGGVPNKMTIDHLCKNKLCVNPAHMEIVTRTENIRRCGLQGVALKESLKTHCPKGHAYADFGVVYKNGLTADRDWETISI